MTMSGLADCDQGTIQGRKARALALPKWAAAPGAASSLLFVTALSLLGMTAGWLTPEFLAIGFWDLLAKVGEATRPRSD